MSDKSMEGLKYDIKKGSLLASNRIFYNVKVDYITAKHIGFTCKDDAFNTSHSVIYFSEKKDFKDMWSCDCKWFSLKHIFCKHVLGVFRRLNNDPSFLKKFEKEKQ